MKHIIIDEFDFITGDGYIHGIDYEKCKKLNSTTIPEIINGNHGIYHYTATLGLKNILKEKELWFTHIQYLNDRTEVDVGVDIYNQRTKQIVENARIINPDISDISVDTSNIHAYVCCFSLERDTLPMWNYYTKDTSNKGYNIGFDYRKLLVSLITQNPKLAGCGVSCGFVNYCLENKSNGSTESLVLTQHHNYVDDAIDYMKIKLTEMDMRLSDVSKEYRDTFRDEINKIQSRLKVLKLRGQEARFDICHTMEVIFFMKKKYFEHEKEFRIIITVPNNKFNDIKKSELYDFRNSNGVLTPYLKLKFDPCALLGITSSPTNNGELVDKSIDEYCNFCGIETDSLIEGITHSEIPVRF